MVFTGEKSLQEEEEKTPSAQKNPNKYLHDLNQ